MIESMFKIDDYHMIKTMFETSSCSILIESMFKIDDYHMIKSMFETSSYSVLIESMFKIGEYHDLNLSTSEIFDSTDCSIDY